MKIFLTPDSETCVARHSVPRFSLTLRSSSFRGLSFVMWTLIYHYLAFVPFWACLPEAHPLQENSVLASVTQQYLGFPLTSGLSLCFLSASSCSSLLSLIGSIKCTADLCTGSPNADIRFARCPWPTPHDIGPSHSLIACQNLY